MVEQNDFLRRIEAWLPYARRFFYVPSDRPDLMCYGTGYDGWGVQTNQKALSAFAVAGAMLQDEQARDEALRLFRYSMETHIEGSHSCTDGCKWGHTWISALGTERMMHAVDALRGSFTSEDEALFRRVLISEAEWLLQSYEVVAGLENSCGRNKPESNLWNGALLYRTSLLYPDHPSAQRYREKAIHFFLNSLSIPSDESSQEILDGERVASHFTGANFFETFALNHHGYLNVGYMVICLSQIAMLHLWCRDHGYPLPESLYHHAAELWRLVKTFTFPDGRLNRIGGDTRARYCYCQDYLIPTWLFAFDLYGDSDIEAYQEGWLKIVGSEQEHNRTGGFLSDRGRELSEISHLYYTRLDSDRACSLSMGAWWCRPVKDRVSSLSVNAETNGASNPGTKPDAELSRYHAWNDEYHGSFFHETGELTCSFTWAGAEGPTGLYIPGGVSDLAEWRHNLTVHVRGEGSVQTCEILKKHVAPFAGGAVASGRYEIQESFYIAEGESDGKVVAVVDLLFALLPDSKTAVVIQHAVSPHRTMVNEVRGFFLQVPNDIWNSFTRDYSWERGSRSIEGYGASKEALTVVSPWISIDSLIRVQRAYGPRNYTIFRPGKRQIGFKRYKQRPYRQEQGMLYCDEICAEFSNSNRFLRPGETFVDSAHILSSPTSIPTSVSAIGQAPDFPSKVRAVDTITSEGKRYLAVLPLEDMSHVTLQLDSHANGKAIDATHGDEYEISKGRLSLGEIGVGKILEIHMG